MIAGFFVGMYVSYRLRHLDHYIEALARAHAETLKQLR